jgi:hypothetical protein
LLHNFPPYIFQLLQMMSYFLTWLVL